MLNINPITDNVEGKFPESADIMRIEQDPLHLDLDDDRLVQVINDRIKKSQSYYKTLDYYNRVEKITNYVKGDQLKDLPKDKFSLPYMENILFEAQMRNKPIALSRLPDLLASAGKEDEQSQDNAELLTDIINSDIQQEKNRFVLGMAYNQRPQWLFSVIKARWNPQLGQYGDYEFYNPHPKNIVLDHTCPVPDPQRMEFIAERAEFSVKQIIMMFPDAKEKFLKYLNWEEIEGNEDRKMASKYWIWEVWFHWYEEMEDPQTLEKKWTRIDGVIWKYQNLILHKMKNPYWDYQGKRRVFDLQPTEDKELSEDDVFRKLFGEDESEQDTIYYNYFRQPQKPYYIMSYFRSGENPIDYTSEYEQVLAHQDMINAEGQQIFMMNSRTKGKFAFAGNKIDKAEIERLKLHDYNQAIVLEGIENIGDAMQVFQGDPAPQQLYRSKQDNRAIGFEMMALNATTRGTRETGDETLGARQMMREQDFGVIDDIVEETINPAARWMSSWVFQLIRLFYTRPHMRRLKGKDGDMLHAVITQDLIEDGMEITVSASGVDKIKRMREAMEMAKMGIIDPLTFFEDIGANRAKERAKRAMLYKIAPQLYLQTYLEDPENPMMPPQMMPQGVGMEQQGMQQPMPPQQPPMGGGVGGGGFGQNDPLGLYV